MKRYISLIAVLAVALAIIIAVQVAMPTQAAPPAAPTPVANILNNDTAAAYLVFQPATALTADTNTRSTLDVMKFDSLDIQYIIDQGTTNTTTLTIQWSIDGTNWEAGPALVSNNAADASDITRVPVFGRYARINQDVTNSNTITITLLAVGK